MPFIFTSKGQQTLWATQSNMIPSAITGLTATSTVAGQITLSWSGGLGNNVKYSYSLSDNTNPIASIGAITGNGVGTPYSVTLTLTTNSQVSTTVTLTATVLGGSVNAVSSSITTLSATMQPFTTINSASSYTTPSVFSGLSQTAYGTGGYSVAVNQIQTKLLFACPAGLYYSTSAIGGTSWTSLTKFVTWNLVSTTPYSANCSLSADGTRGIAGGQYTDVYSINWSSSVPTSNTITSYGSTANAPWWWSTTITTDGMVAFLNGTNQGSNAGTYYCVWNSGTSTYGTVSLLPLQSGGTIGGTHAAIAISPDKTTLISETQWNVSYIPLSWSINSPTATANWASTGIACDMRCICFLGGGYSGTPKYLLLQNASTTGGSGSGFSTSSSLYRTAWNHTTKAATSPVTFMTAIKPPGNGNISIQACGDNGNIIYLVENIISSGSLFNISYFSFNVT